MTRAQLLQLLIDLERLYDQLGATEDAAVEIESHFEFGTAMRDVRELQSRVLHLLETSE